MPHASLRLFFALPCPPELAPLLCAWRVQQKFDGVPVPAANLHLTLAFLGNQPAARLAALCKLAAGIRGRSFTLQLDQAGMLGEHYACLLPATPAPALLELVSELNDGLRTLGIRPDPRPFRAHVTLLRNARGTAVSAPALNWPAQRFALYASHNDGEGVRYQILGHWPLATAAAPRGDSTQH